MIHPKKLTIWQIRIGKDFIQVVLQDISREETFLITKVKAGSHTLEISLTKTNEVLLIDLLIKGLICMSGPPN